MALDHRRVIHFVDVIPCQHEHVVGIVLVDEVEILKHGIGRAFVPIAAASLLGRPELDEFPDLRAQIVPALLHVLD
jgi:hypothetical protein